MARADLLTLLERAGERAEYRVIRALLVHN